MRTRIAVVGVVMAAWVAGAGFILAREPDGQNAVNAEQLIAEALAGDPSKEVNAQFYTLLPGTVLPWHIHPDAHEITYIVEGALTFQRAGQEPKAIAAGEAAYLEPNVVHRGMNESGRLVKFFVVRIKPKDKPLVEEVAPPE